MHAPTHLHNACHLFSLFIFIFALRCVYKMYFRFVRSSNIAEAKEEFRVEIES